VLPAFALLNYRSSGILWRIFAKLEAAMGGAGGRGPHISQPPWSNGKKKALDVGGPSSIDFIVERSYCKRPVQCLAYSKILTPTPSLPGECVPPAFCAAGGHTRWVERGWGGQYFGIRQTQLCTLHM
jgi:hypothetical protein